MHWDNGCEGRVLSALRKNGELRGGLGTLWSGKISLILKHDLKGEGGIREQPRVFQTENKTDGSLSSGDKWICWVLGPEKERYMAEQNDEGAGWEWKDWKGREGPDLAGPRRPPCSLGPLSQHKWEVTERRTAWFHSRLGWEAGLSGERLVQLHWESRDQMLLGLLFSFI